MSSLRWRSLQVRVPLVTLAIFLPGIWSLAGYASRTLREDMQKLRGERQFSTLFSHAVPDFATLHAAEADGLALERSCAIRVAHAELADVSAGEHRAGGVDDLALGRVLRSESGAGERVSFIGVHGSGRVFGQLGGLIGRI